MDIQILYDYQHKDYSDVMSSIAAKLAKENNICIKVDSVTDSEIFSKLCSNPNYTFLIMHVGSEVRDAFEQVEKCRRFTESIIVAESKRFMKCSANISGCFDDFIYPPSESSLRRLLEKHGFLEGKN